MKCSNKLLQKLSYIWITKTNIAFWLLFCAIFSLNECAGPNQHRTGYLLMKTLNRKGKIKSEDGHTFIPKSMEMAGTHYL